LALDLREAAELLLLTYDELPGTQLSTDIPSRIGGWWVPMHERFRRPAEERDRILNDLGLSPFPTLIVAVEGQTEEFVLGKALELFGLAVGLGGIEMAPLRGVGNDIGVLARYARAPRLAEELADSVLLRRPLVHLAVIVDPEGRFASSEGRASVKAQLVADLVLSLPERFRTQTLSEDFSNLVTVDTWGGLGGPFEFAHFTDEELASAVLEVANAVHVDRGQVVAAFAGQRRSPAPDVDKVVQSNCSLAFKGRPRSRSLPISGGRLSRKWQRSQWMAAAQISSSPASVSNSSRVKKGSTW
jgi:hypothetical protein